MNSKPMDELFKRIESFNDNDAILFRLIEIAEDASEENENAIDSYWLKEAACNLEGMFGLLMDLKKAHDLINNATTKEN